MRRSADLTGIGTLPTYRIGLESYDADKLGLGPMMVQSADAGAEGKWIGPLPVALARPMEQSTAIPGIYPWAMRWSESATSQIDWIFLADNATAAATRRIVHYEFNRLTGAFAWKGFITLTPPPGTNQTVRGFRMTYHTYTTGTVAVSGTAVTGTGTGWQAARVPVGCRIGFGSTDPTQIATWYEISAIGSDTGITLTTNAGTIAAGTPFVIEDLRAVMVTTAATATNGGVFVAKGLRPELFSSAGTTIAAATTVDSIRAVYWLKDAATETNTVANGCGLQAAGESFTSQTLWVGNGTTTLQLFRYDIRAALTSLSAGATTATFAYSTAVSATLTGTASQANNGRCATLGHGPGSGVECYYFTTTTRVYRTKALSAITTGDTTFLTGGDVMTEVPPGGANTIAASSLLNSVEHLGSLDKLLLCLNTSNTPFRPYVTQYRADGGQLDRVFGCDARMINQSAADSSAPVVPSILGTAFSSWGEGGLVYVATIGTTAQTNFLYALPLGADWEYAAATGCRIIAPRIATPDADRYVAACIADLDALGGLTGLNLGVSAEPKRTYYRTSGISDNSGGWTLLDGTKRFSAAGATHIQFMFEFRTIGFSCAPARIVAVGVTYDDTSTLAQFEFSDAKTDAATKKFAWRYKTAFGGSVPALRVRIYNAVSGALLVDDNTAAPTGTFERSTDGTTWGAWTNADKGNETTYLRYTPASIADSVLARPVLTLN